MTFSRCKGPQISFLLSTSIMKTAWVVIGIVSFVVVQASARSFDCGLGGWDLLPSRSGCGCPPKTTCCTSYPSPCDCPKTTCCTTIPSPCGCPKTTCCSTCPSPPSCCNLPSCGLPSCGLPIWGLPNCGLPSCGLPSCGLPFELPAGLPWGAHGLQGFSSLPCGLPPCCPVPKTTTCTTIPFGNPICGKTTTCTTYPNPCGKSTTTCTTVPHANPACAKTTTCHTLPLDPCGFQCPPLCPSSFHLPPGKCGNPLCKCGYCQCPSPCNCGHY